MSLKWKSKGYFSCDFETANNLELNKDETYVWLACGYNILEDKVEHISTNIESFFNDFIFTHPNCYFYFHNLAFDGTFILDYLLNQGFKPIEYIEQYQDKTFKSCIDDEGKYYYLDIIRWSKTQNKFEHFMIYDSYKLIPIRAEKIANDFGLETKKGKIDYDKARAKDYVATAEEIEYIKNDVKIIGQAIKFFIDNDLLKGFTIGQCAWNVFTETVPNWRGYFPQLTREQDNFCRKAYKGGYVYLKEEYKEKVIHNGLIYDINSNYSSQMKNKPHPYGIPIYYKGEYKPNEVYPLYIQRVVVDMVPKEGMLPTIQVKKNWLYSDHEYITNTLEPLELTLTSVDLDLMKKHYHILSIEYIDGYMFLSSTKIFRKYIERFEKLKIENNDKPAIRQIAKLFLNNLYGQLVKRPIRQQKRPKLDNGVLSFEKGETYMIETTYSPDGAFTTSYGREQQITSAQANYERFIYGDTDSLHLIGLEPPTNLEIDDVKFGARKLEAKFDTAKYIRAKTYMYFSQDKKVVKMSGLQQSISDKINIEEFKVGATYNGKLIPKRVKGGTILTPIDFTLKET